MSKVYIFFADGLEEIEGLTVVDMMRPVFRRSTRKIPTFPSSRLSSSVPSNLGFSHIYRKFLMPFLGSFLLKKFLGYVIIIVLYSTLFGGRLWHTI